MARATLALEGSQGAVADLTRRILPLVDDAAHLL